MKFKKYFRIITKLLQLLYFCDTIVLLRGDFILRLLVISDTHMYISNATKLINEYNPDYILHLGDICDDCERLSEIFPNKIILSVIGNNDFGSAYPDFPKERVFTLGGKNFLMCHGHTYHVKSSLSSLKRRGRAVKADVILFGHTHEKYLEKDGDVIIMNPGTVWSYGIIELTDGEIDARVESV